MTTIYKWIDSADCVAVPEASSANGQGRGDGYDVDAYRSSRTGRYIIGVYRIKSGTTLWYVASSLDGAMAVGRSGYIPGTAPGKYENVVAPHRLEECAGQATIS